MLVSIYITNVDIDLFIYIFICFRYKCSDPKFEMKVQKVYFYWICPDTNAFEWFSDLLKYLEEQMAESGKRGFLEYKIYLTRGWGVDQVNNQGVNIKYT